MTPTLLTYATPSDQAPSQSDPTEDLISHFPIYPDVTFPSGCKVCDTQFANDSSLRRHMLDTHTTRIHHCHKCPSFFTTRSRLYKHTKTHGAADTFICRLCKTTHLDKKHLENHIKTDHPKVKRNKCHICNGKEFSRKSTHTNHMKRKHNYRVHHGTLIRDQATQYQPPPSPPRYLPPTPGINGYPPHNTLPPMCCHTPYWNNHAHTTQHTHPYHSFPPITNRDLYDTTTLLTHHHNDATNNDLYNSIALLAQNNDDDGMDLMKGASTDQQLIGHTIGVTQSPTTPPDWSLPTNN